MLRPYSKQFSYSILFLFSLMILTNCTANQVSKVYSVNSDGIIETQPDTMVKDAIRFKGKILTKAIKQSRDFVYEVEVLELIRYGSTFSTIEPKVGDKVKLYVFQKVKFKKGYEIILDATTRQESGVIIMNAITK